MATAVCIVYDNGSSIYANDKVTKVILHQLLGGSLCLADGCFFVFCPTFCSPRRYQLSGNSKRYKRYTIKQLHKP